MKTAIIIRKIFIERGRKGKQEQTPYDNCNHNRNSISRTFFIEAVKGTGTDPYENYNNNRNNISRTFFMEATGTGNRFLMKTAILIGTIFLELPVWRPQGEREQVPDSPGLRVFLLQGPGLLWTSKGYFLFCSLCYLSLYLPCHLCIGIHMYVCILYIL